MTLQTDLAAAVAKVTADSTLLHCVVHGPAAGVASLISTEGGPVKTVARAVADAEEFLHREASDLVGAVAAARDAKDAAAGFAGLAGEKAGEAAVAMGRATTAAEQAAADIRSAATMAETNICDLVAQAESQAQTHITAADAAASEAEGHASEARAYAARFALPIEAVARRALAAQNRQLVGTRDTLTLFSAFADEAGQSETAAKASADEAARQAGIAADQVTAAELAADAARASVVDAGAVVAQADAGLRALSAEVQADVNSAQATIAASTTSAEDHIASTAAGFESEVQELAAMTRAQINAAATHVSRFVLPIEQVARAVLDAERRRLLDARDDLLRFATIIES
jgi:hypothetical protein